MREETGAGVYGKSVGRRLSSSLADMQQCFRLRDMLSWPVFTKFNFRLDLRNMYLL